MNTITKESQELLDEFFKEHKLFFCDDVSWKIYKKDNLETRLIYLFSKFGFFETSLKELDDEYMDEQSFYKRGDNPDYHENKRYVIQEVLDEKIHNPIHASFKFNDFGVDIYGNLHKTAIHPGHTRYESSVFLKKNLKKGFFYTRKKYYNNDEVFKGLKEMKSFEDIMKHWTERPLTKDEIKIRGNNNVCNFIHLMQDSNGKLRKTKYHDETECSILKLWNWWADVKDNDNKIVRIDLLHTTKYLDYIRESSKDITNTLFEKKLTIYTNSKIDVKSYFKNIQEYLLQKANEQLLFVSNKHEQFDFDVVVVDKKPDNISKLNGSKGFAVWIDKDILGSITRDIYEFLVFTRKDIKLAETKDGKISVVNCRNIGDNKWTIHKEFYL
tara:strand:+ start:326 stop:1477 length:1152 start_codon:yes stop_codon:yes gene_type:complete